jgi:hypothetical protein
MATSISVKRGDTFTLDFALTESDGTTPLDMTGWTVRSQVRRRKTLVADLVFTAIDAAAGTFRLACADTTDWPRGELQSDIEYTDLSGRVISTETYTIEVLEDVTYG